MDESPAPPPLTPAPALYAQIIAQVTEEIRSGPLRPGDRLPPERALADRFQVSRVTIRRALADLAASGLVDSQQGRGTFVTAPLVGETANTLMSFSELGTARGLTPGSRVLGQVVRPATLDEAGSFDVAPGTPILELERLRLLDDIPISIDVSRLPLVHAPGLEAVDLGAGSLYEALAEAGAAPVRAHYTVRAGVATSEQSELLDLPAGGAVLLTSTTSYDHRNRVVELGRMIYRGDRYQFQATLWRRDHG
ncbi:MAG: GntR family transcriptional regulator [Propioniciclava sp.]